jgi:DNA (cytosine-5)-methyltransferase 1
LDICVGAGGLALGTAKAGFEHVAVIDFDNTACETLRFNRGNDVAHVRDWNIVEADIADVDFSAHTDIDLLSGGPPCQPFSQAGRRHGRSDRRELFPHFIRAVGECQPKSFVIENVRGLFDRPFSNYFNYLIHQLRFPHVQRRKGERWSEHTARLERLYTSGRYRGLQYTVISQVLNAADFGVAQRRLRVFIVGICADLEIEYSFPIPTHSREALWLSQWVNSDYWERHGIPKARTPETSVAVQKILPRLNREPTTRPWRTVRDAIGDLPNVGLGRSSRKVLNHFLNPGARAYDGHDGSRMDEPAKTIKAGHNGVPGGENMLRLDDSTVRYFSVRECARLQAFPDDWAFDGSWCACMRQIGNAVPVTLAEVVAAPLANALLVRSESGVMNPAQS